MTRRKSVVVAVVLWLALAFTVWNVVFDLSLVAAGRRYSYDAAMLFRTSGQYLRIDDVMRPALRHAVRLASLSGGLIAAVGLLLIRVAVVRERGKQASGAEAGV